MAGLPREIFRPISWRPGSVVNYRCDACNKEFESDIIGLKDCPYCTPVDSVGIWTPIDIADAAQRFPVMVRHLIPEWRLIPDIYKGGSKWAVLAREWYHSGLEYPNFVPKPGIDEGKAVNHIRAIFSLDRVSLEHQIAATAYLLAQWFEDATFEKERR